MPDVLMILNNLAKNLDRLMSDAHISSSELSRRINVPSDTIKKIRTNKNTNPTISTLTPITKYFKISISQLIGEDQNIPENFQWSLRDDNKVEDYKIPIISWEDALSWPTIKNVADKFCNVLGHNLSKLTYGIQIKNTDYKVFERGAILFVDPEGKYINNDYVLVYKLGQTFPTIKKLLQNENNCYLETIIFGLNSIQPIATDDKILGVIVGYEKWFK